MCVSDLYDTLSDILTPVEISCPRSKRHSRNLAFADAMQSEIHNFPMFCFVREAQHITRKMM